MFSHFKNILIYVMYLHYSINFMKSKKPCFSSSVILCIVGAEFHDPLKELKRHFERVKSTLSKGIITL